MLFGFMCLITSSGFAQYTEREVLERLSELQITDDAFYEEGLFPVKRSWGFWGKAEEDNSIFFSASIAATLQELQQRRLLADSTLTKRIVARVAANYEKYRSRNGLPSYNFWQTVPPDLPFPNGGRLISNEKMRLPDDLDTSVLIALSQAQNDTLARQLREYLIEYSGRSYRGETDLITKEAYEDVPAYEVWFGRDMPQTFDICVLSNVLLFVVRNDFPLSRFDSSSFHLLNEMIKQDDHLKDMEAISHHTSSSAVILYHVARLIASDSSHLTNEINAKVVADIRKELSTTDSELEKIMLATSMMRLGEDYKMDIDYEKLVDEVAEYSLFEINPFAVSRGSFGLSALIPTMTWVSEACNWTMVLEYLAFKNAALY